MIGLLLIRTNHHHKKVYKGSKWHITTDRQHLIVHNCSIFSCVSKLFLFAVSSSSGSTAAPGTKDDATPEGVGHMEVEDEARGLLQASNLNTGVESATGCGPKRSPALMLMGTRLCLQVWRTKPPTLQSSSPPLPPTTGGPAMSGVKLWPNSPSDMGKTKSSLSTSSPLQALSKV